MTLLVLHLISKTLLVVGVGNVLIQIPKLVLFKLHKTLVKTLVKHNEMKQMLKN